MATIKDLEEQVAQDRERHSAFYAATLEREREAKAKAESKVESQNQTAFDILATTTKELADRRLQDERAAKSRGGWILAAAAFIGFFVFCYATGTVPALVENKNAFRATSAETKDAQHVNAGNSNEIPDDIRKLPAGTKPTDWHTPKERDVEEFLARAIKPATQPSLVQVSAGGNLQNVVVFVGDKNTQTFHMATTRPVKPTTQSVTITNGTTTPVTVVPLPEQQTTAPAAQATQPSNATSSALPPASTAPAATQSTQPAYTHAPANSYAWANPEEGIQWMEYSPAWLTIYNDKGQIIASQQYYKIGYRPVKRPPVLDGKPYKIGPDTINEFMVMKEPNGIFYPLTEHVRGSITKDRVVPQGKRREGPPSSIGGTPKFRRI